MLFFKIEPASWHFIYRDT